MPKLWVTTQRENADAQDHTLKQQLDDAIKRLHTLTSFAMRKQIKKNPDMVLDVEKVAIVNDEINKYFILDQGYAEDTREPVIIKHELTALRENIVNHRIDLSDLRAWWQSCPNQQLAIRANDTLTKIETIANIAKARIIAHVDFEINNLPLSAYAIESKI